MDEKDGRVSLKPLDPEQALRALLKVDPDSEPVEADERSEKSKSKKPETS